MSPVFFDFRSVFEVIAMALKQGGREGGGLLRTSMIKVRNHVTPLRCFRISARILFFGGEARHSYFSTLMQNILQTVKESEEDFQ